MMERKTSVSDGYNEIRARIGLQFFAEEDLPTAETTDTGADTDGFDESDFETGLLGDALEDQQGAEQQAGEGADGDGENQPAADQTNDPVKPGGEDTPPDAANADAEGIQAPAAVPLTYNGQQILLPADAVQALTGALGANPVELLQKGMNYDAKGERELRLLDQYAAASGLTRQQYLDQLESAQREGEVADEIERARQEFPETPDAALRTIAETRVSQKREAQRQQAEQQRQTIEQAQQRIKQTVEQARHEATIKAWDAYEKVAGVHKPEEVPPRVLELVAKEQMDPVAAHWRHQAELAEQKSKIESKQQQNRQTAPGSMAGAGESVGFEADFMKAFM